MGFSKETYEPDVAYGVAHPYYPGEEFTFYVLKEIPQSALDLEKEFFGLTDETRGEQSAKLLTRMVAAITTRPPENFKDFPMDERPLSERFFEYFFDPAKLELESFITRVWRAHRLATLDPAYLKSVQDNGAGSGDVSPATQQA